MENDSFGFSAASLFTLKSSICHKPLESDYLRLLIGEKKERILVKNNRNEGYLQKLCLSTSPKLQDLTSSV